MWSGDLAWLVVFVQAVLPQDWHSFAGQAFRTAMQAIREFAEKNRLLPKDLAERGLEAGFRKVKVHFSHEHADARAAAVEKAQAVGVSAIREAEQIEMVLEKRRQESASREGDEDRRIAAEADRAETEAARAELKFLDDLKRLGMAELLKRPEGATLRKMLKRLDGAGVLPCWDEKNKNLTILPRPQDSPSLLPPDSEPEDSSSKRTA
jgi:hypothetical protein